MKILRILASRILALIVLVVMMVMMGGEVIAQCTAVSTSLRLEWDPSISLDVHEVQLFFAQTAGGHDFDAPAHATIPVATVGWNYADGPALANGQYFVVAKAADAAGNMSGLSSNEVCVDIDQEGPSDPPTNLRILINIAVGIEVEIDGVPVSTAQK